MNFGSSFLAEPIVPTNAEIREQQKQRKKVVEEVKVAEMTPSRGSSLLKSAENF